MAAEAADREDQTLRGALISNGQKADGFPYREALDEFVMRGES